MKITRIIALCCLSSALSAPAPAAGEYGGYKTEVSTLSEYSQNLKLMRSLFRDRQLQMPLLHVVQAKRLGGQFRRSSLDNIPESRKSDILKNPALVAFAQRNKLIEIIETTDSNPLNGALVGSALPKGLDSGHPWIYKVFFKGQQVGEHLSWTDGVAQTSISQLQISKDGSHFSYVVDTNFDASGNYTRRQAYVVVNGKRGPVVDAMSRIMMSVTGSSIAFRAITNEQATDYTLADSASVSIKPAVPSPAVGWQPDADYITKARRLITRAWFPPKMNESKIVTVQFTLLKNGSIAGEHISQTSSVASADKSALTAVQNAAPFEPLGSNAPAQIRMKMRFDYDGGPHLEVLP